MPSKSGSWFCILDPKPSKCLDNVRVKELEWQYGRIVERYNPPYTRLPKCNVANSDAGTMPPFANGI